jgi:hypothetical protein
MLATAAPPWSVLRHLPHDLVASVLQDWEVLTPWRQSRLWFDLAVQATVPPAGVAA